jgi:hypothetical protein
LGQQRFVEHHHRAARLGVLEQRRQLCLAFRLAEPFLVEELEFDDGAAKDIVGPTSSRRS